MFENGLTADEGRALGLVLHHFPEVVISYQVMKQVRATGKFPMDADAFFKLVADEELLAYDSVRLGLADVELLREHVPRQVFPLSSEEDLAQKLPYLASLMRQLRAPGHEQIGKA